VEVLRPQKLQIITETKTLTKNQLLARMILLLFPKTKRAWVKTIKKVIKQEMIYAFSIKTAVYC